MTLFTLRHFTKQRYQINTVKLTCAKLPANASIFNCKLHVEKYHTQFTCATRSAVYLYKQVKLPASTRRKARAGNTQIACSHMYTYQNITLTLQVILHAQPMQIHPQRYLLLQAKTHAICRQKNSQSTAEITAIARKKTPRYKENYL